MAYKPTTVFVAFFLVGLLFFPRILYSVSTILQTSNLIAAPEFISHTSSTRLRSDISFTTSIQKASFPNISAEAVLVADLEENTIWYERSSTETVPIASLTKIMTSILFAESANLRDLYSVADQVKKASGKISKIPAGSWISGEDVIKLMIIESDNDIALLAAEKMGRLTNFKNGSVLSFDNAIRTSVSSMNGKAFDLGMYNTFFTNPIGLDDALLYSTARDLHVLMQYLWTKHNDIWEYSRHTEERVGIHSAKNAPISSYITITNTNPLLEKFPRIIGSKTGTTGEAKEALVFIYRLQSGVDIAVILLKSSDRFREAEKIIHWLDQ